MDRGSIFVDAAATHRALHSRPHPRQELVHTVGRGVACPLNERVCIILNVDLQWLDGGFFFQVRYSSVEARGWRGRDATHQSMLCGANAGDII